MSDRKYKHKGYQDSGGYGSGSSGSRPPREPRAPEPGNQRLEGAPRGRTAGGFGPEAFKCNACGQQRQNLGEFTHDEACSKCGADLHTCGNCRAFDATTMWECRENIPVRVPAKQVRNQCALFSPKIVRDLAADKGRQPQTPDNARKAFDALFKK